MRNRRDGPPESWQLKASLAVGVTLRGTRAPLTAEPPPLTPWGVGPAAEPRFRGVDLWWLWAVSSGPASPHNGDYGGPRVVPTHLPAGLGLVRSLKAALPTLSSCDFPGPPHFGVIQSPPRVCTTLGGRPRAQASPCSWP